MHHLAVAKSLGWQLKARRVLVCATTLQKSPRCAIILSLHCDAQLMQDAETNGLVYQQGERTSSKVRACLLKKEP